MSKVTVYSFWHYDIGDDVSYLSPSKRTAEAIKLIGKEPILETAEDVEEAELDSEGRYRPKNGEGL